MGRRAVLIGGAGVAALVGTGGVALLAPRPPARGRKNLSVTEAGVALALAEVLFREGPTPADADVLGRLDLAVGEMHPETRRLFLIGLRALEYATLPSFLGRFSRLDLERRVAAVRSWEKRPYLWSAAMVSLRFQVGMAYFESDVARQACGWSLGCTPSGAAD